MEVLEVLLWGAEMLSRPSLSRWAESFETWQHRHGLQRQWGRLEQSKLVAQEDRAGQIVHRLTDLGRLVALGGPNPERQWERKWDGQWRMLVFDLPVSQGRVRARLLRWLRQNGFSYLQDSVWIHPDPVAEIADVLKDFRDDVESFTILEAHCCSGHTNTTLVRGAWHFDHINKRYEAYLRQADGLLRQTLLSRDESNLRRRLREQRRTWAAAVAMDPLLPQELLPADYLGQRAWQAHRSVMTRLVPALLASSPLP